MKRKLVVTRETLRNLNAAELKNADLQNAAGGRFVSNHATICNCNESISCYTCGAGC
jgi:hypothetical protein